MKLTFFKAIVLKKIFDNPAFAITRPLLMVFNFRVCLFILAAVFCLTSCKKRELPVHEPVIKIDSINRGYLLGADNMQAGVNADLSAEYFFF